MPGASREASPGARRRRRRRGAHCLVLQLSAEGPLRGGRGAPAPALRPRGHSALPPTTRRGNERPLACRLRATAPLGPGSPSAERPGGRTRLPALGGRARVCYCHQDLHCRCLHARARARFCGACAPSYYAAACGDSGERWSTVHFRGGRIRQVRCNTVLSGCRPLWPPPCCRHLPTPFALCALLGPLIPAPG